MRCNRRWTSDLERFLNQERQLPALFYIVGWRTSSSRPFIHSLTARPCRPAADHLSPGVSRRTEQGRLLYLSYYLKANRAEYYDRLMAVRNDGDWEGWLRFFLEGVRATAEEASANIRTINRMREEHHTRIREQSSSVNALRLLDLLFRRPIINVLVVSRELNIAFNTATRAVNQLESLEMLEEMTGSQRNRRYQYAPYLKLFLDDAAAGIRARRDTGDRGK